MQTLRKIRDYEALLIIISVIIYVVRRLVQEASNFDALITSAELNKIPSKIIWQNLASYDHVGNTNFPTIVAACLFVVAWYIFHYMAFPKIKEKVFDSSVFAYLFIILVVCAVSVFIYSSLRLYIRPQTDGYSHIVGFKVYSLFRKLYVLTDTVAVFLMFLTYEGFAQFYYFIHTKLKEEKEENFKYLDYFLLGIIVFTFLTFALFGTLPSKINWSKILNKLLALGVVGVTNYYSQYYFKKNILQNLDNIQSKQILKFLFINLLGAIITIFILEKTVLNFIFHLAEVLILFFGFVFISIISVFLIKVITQEKTQLKTAISQKSAELSSLRSQINPHFLFNALNTLYSVSLKESAEKTADGIQKLGDMMRFMLNENHQDRIPLSKEIAYLNNYIAIQSMRIDENHNIEIKVNIHTGGETHSEREVFIAPMLLNPFVENAFKHGISFRNPSWIYITLTHDAQKLYFKVHNSLHPKTESDLLEAENNGIGLENVQKRLELIYPNRYSLDIQASDNDYFVSLVLEIY